MLREEGVYYYCNLSSPFAYDSEALKYIDYDLDIKVYPDMTYTLLDEDEYEKHSQIMQYPPVIDTILKRNVAQLTQWIHQRKVKFAPDFVDMWYERYLMYRIKTNLQGISPQVCPIRGGLCARYKKIFAIC